MGRSPCCSKVGLNRGAWTALEDKILIDYIKVNGEGRWRNLSKKAGLMRCGKSCRLRWLNYLRPDIKRGNISPDEEELIIRLHKLLGNRWSLIAGRLPGRTDNEIKNYWNTTLGKKMHDHHNSASNTCKRSNTQSIEKNKKTGKTESQHKDESNVVRTKAVRCTKVYFSPQLHKIEPIDSNNNPEQCIPEHNSINTDTTQQGSDYGISSFTPQEDNLSNFMLDVDTEEVFPSYLLKSDFLNLFDNNYLDDLSPSSNVLPMIEDWTLSDYIQQNVASNHLDELGMEWL